MLLVASILSGILYLYAICNRMCVQHETILALMSTGSLAFVAVQLLLVFHQMPVDWPEPLSSFVDVLQVFTSFSKFLRPSCIFRTNDATTGYVISVMAQLLFTSPWLICCPLCWRASSLHRFVNSHGAMLLVLYTSLCINGFLPWQCEHNPDGSFSVSAARSVLCFRTGTHTVMLVISLLLNVFAVGFLALVAWATWGYPQQMVRRGDLVFTDCLGFIFHRVRPKVYYYTFLCCLRCLFLALVPVVFVNKVDLQLMVALTIVAVGLVLQARLRPWRQAFANVVDSSSSVLLLMVLVGGALIQGHGEGHVAQTINAMFLWLLRICVFSIFAILGYHSCQMWLLRLKPVAIYLCYHKVGGMLMARWWRLMLGCRLHQSAVFDSGDMLADSGEGSDFYRLLQIVAYETSNVVLLLTRETLRQIWCASELTIAMQHHVRIVKVSCNSYLMPTDDFIDGLANSWTDQERAEARVLGINMAMIQDTYRKLRDLDEVRFDRKDASHMSTVRQVLARCERTSASESLTVNLADHRSLREFADGEGEGGHSESDILIIGNAEGIESLLTSDVLKCMLERRTCRPVKIASADVHEALQQLDEARVVIAVLLRGTLEDGGFATLLAAAKGKKGKNGVHLVPVVADPLFSFHGFRKDCVEMEAPVTASGTRSTLEVRVHDVYRWMFNIVSLRFSTHGSLALQESEIECMAARLMQPMGPTYGARVYL
jgi:hypothetical protein